MRAGVEQPWPPNGGRCPNGCPETCVYGGVRGSSFNWHSKTAWCLACGWSRNRRGHEKIPA